MREGETERRRDRKGLPEAAVAAIFFSLSLALSASLSAAEAPSRRERLQWAAEAHTLFSQKKYDEAARWLEKAVAPGASNRDLAEWWPVLGRCYEAGGNYQKALVAYQQAHQLAPDSQDRVLDLARVYARVELDDRAVELYERALAREKQRKDVMWALAQLYERQRSWEKARDLTGRYLKLEPRDAEAEQLMARIEEALGDAASAARRMEAVLAVRPSGEGYYRAGRLWARLGQFDLAERAYESAAAQKFALPAFILERGLLAWRRGDGATAAKFWRSALAAEPGLPAARFLLALNDVESGRRASAADEMRRLSSEEDGGFVRELAEAYIAAQERK